MRKLLLNNRANNSTPFKKLRQLLVLFALVLMPIGAWADSYFGINTSTGSHWVTDENATNILGDGTMSYDITNNVLTLDNAELAFTSDIFADAFIAMADPDHPSITVHLKGANTLTLGDKASVFNGTSITFTAEDTNASLDIVTESGWTGALFLDNQSSNPISATYNSHLFLEKIREDEYHIQTLICEGPASFNDGNNIVFRFGDQTACTDEQTHYSIDYVDENLQDVADVVWVYGDGDVSLLGPCTMTYYKTAGGGQSETMTAKLFGLATNSVTTTLGTPVAPPTIVPAFDHSEDLIITETQTPATGLAPSYDGTSGLISTSSTGETTCSMKVDYYEASSYDYLVLNDMDDYEKYIFGNFTLTVNASTATSYGITVGNTQVTSANAANVLNDDYSSVSYDATTNTLTLKGVHLNSTNNGISVSSDLNINLVGYSNVGTINVTSGTLNFTTSTTLPGCLITDITGNSTITYGDGTGLSWDGSMVKSSSTNPYIIYATGCKMDGDNYCISGGDFSVKDNKGGEAALDVSTDGTVANSLNNASIDYYKVSSNSKSCYIYPANLDDMNLVTKAYLLFDWGTCTNKDVKVQIKGLDSNYADDGTYSEEVSLPADGGLVEIPLTGTVNSNYFQIYFSSSTGEFSFIPISVGFLKTEGYGLTVAGVEVTADNASNITGANIQGTVSYDVENHKLTLNGVTLTSPIHWGTDANLTIELKGTNSMNTTNGVCISSEYDTRNIIFTGGDNNCSLELSTVTDDYFFSGFSNTDNPSMGTGMYWIPTWDDGTITSALITNAILGGGAGTEESPFIISSFEHLKTFAKYINDGILSTEYFQLGGDIDCTNQTGFEPIGNTPKSFIGTFNGAGKSIIGLIFSNTNPDGVSGLFGNIGKINYTTEEINRGTVKNLILNGCQFENGCRNGAIAGNLAYGTIENCTVTSCTISSGNSQSTFSGGITGIVEADGIVKNCTVNDGTITSSTSDSNNGEVYAGGIVAYAYGGSEINGCTVTDVSINSTGNDQNSYSGGIVGYSDATISGNSVEGTTTVNSINNNNDFINLAGAIVAKREEGLLTNNYYYFTVKTRTTYGNNDPVEKSVYTQRAVGGILNEQTPDITENNGAVMYTKIVSLPTENSAGTVAGVDGTYYKVDGTSLYVAPGQTAKINATPSTANNFALAWLQAVKTGTADVVICDSTNITGGGRQYTFTMPDAEVTVNVSWEELYNLWIGETQVTSDNAANVLGDDTGSVSFSATVGADTAPTYTLTLNGATITGPVKVGLPNLTVDVQGTNSITVPEGNVFKLMNDETAVTCNITFKTSTADGKLTLTSTSNGTIERGGVFNYFSYRDYQDESNSYEAKFDIIIDKTIGLIQPTNSYYLTDGSEEYHVVRFAPSLGVSIGDGYGGTKVITEDNAADVFEDGTVSFDKTKNILTLNGASLSAPLSTSLATLTVDLIGENTLRNYYDGHVIETPYGDDATVNIKSTAEDGSLTMTMSSSQDGRMVSEHVNLDIADPLTILSGKLEGNSGNNNTVVIGVNYHLTVAGVDVTSLNKDKVLGDDKITFTPSSNTLNLNGATIEGSILYDGEADLTIALNSVNSVTNEYGTYAIYTNGGNFNFMKADGATSAELTATCGNGYTPISTYVSTLGSGLYWKPVELNSTVITDDPQFVIVDGLIMTDDRTVNGSSGTITYNSTDKILTLTGFIKEFGTSHAIKTGVSGLKVKLVGESRITCLVTDSAAFYAFHPDASIQFVKDDNTSKLTMVGTTFEHFGDNSITYDGLVYYTEKQIIAIPDPPMMATEMVDEEYKVVLTKEYEDGDIYYTITYADGVTANVSKTKFTEPFEMSAPGTVEAWVEATNGTAMTSTVKGKYFGYKDEPYKMKVSDTKTAQLIPAIAETDYIVINSSEIDDEEVATIDNGVITALGFGKATLETDLGYNDQLEVYILNPDYKVTAKIYVGEELEGLTFTEGMNYATYCNTSGIDRTVPEGLTAYAVTGVTNNAVTLVQVGFLPKRDSDFGYVPLLIKRDETSTSVGISLIYDGNEDRPTDNLLEYASNGAVNTTGKEYVLYKDEFVKATGDIPANKCYLYLTDVNIPSGSRSLGIDSDGTTGINQIDNEQLTIDNDVWYDLQGRRIEKPTKAGLYIKNGKKVIVNNK